jgi:DNA-binding transcriptional MerR regulator
MEISMPRRIGDVAKAAGVGVETVRFYEREGLIDRPIKPQRGWREYDDVALAQLGQVKLAQAFGLTLKDMKRLKARATGPRTAFCSDVRNTVSVRLAVIEDEIAELQNKRVALKRWLGQCKRRDDTIDCPLYAQINALVKPAKRKRS